MPKRQRQTLLPEVAAGPDAKRQRIAWSAEKVDELFAWQWQRVRNEPADKHSIDYAAWTRRWDKDRMLKVAREQCAAAFSILDNGKTRDLATFESLPYSQSINGGVWYLAILKDTAAPEWYKLYTGQAGSKSDTFRNRKYKHEYAHRNPGSPGHTLFHRVWAQAPTRYVNWRFYGTYQPIAGFTPKDVECWMNFMEQFFACAFQTLPTLFLSSKRGAQPTVSTSWTPEWLVAEEEVGLNQKLPICQNTDFGNRFGGLANSADPEVRAAFQEWQSNHLDAARELGYAAHKANNFENLAKATKASANGNGEWWRAADPAKGEPTSVRCRCTSCNQFEWTDTLPTFSMFGYGYIASRVKRCDVCAEGARKRKDTQFVPINPDLAWGMGEGAGFAGGPEPSARWDAESYDFIVSSKPPQSKKKPRNEDARATPRCIPPVSFSEPTEDHPPYVVEPYRCPMDPEAASRLVSKSRRPSTNPPF
ncbi:hypothetical protein DL768_010463 [Monosporascus sp. mg162]|nr:hypothetical protein DL768_010463 [Monosporascus sp. mg162]